MSSLSQTIEGELLEYLVGRKKASELALSSITVWVALTIEAPTSATTTSTVKEALYTGHKRVEVKGTEFEAAVLGTPSEILNKNEIKFPESTGGENSKVGWAVLFSAETGGTMIAWGPLGSEKTIEKEATPSIAAKGAKFTLS